MVLPSMISPTAISNTCRLGVGLGSKVSDGWIEGKGVITVALCFGVAVWVGLVVAVFKVGGNVSSGAAELAWQAARKNENRQINAKERRIGLTWCVEVGKTVRLCMISEVED